MPSYLPAKLKAASLGHVSQPDLPIGATTYCGQTRFKSDIEKGRKIRLHVQNASHKMLRFGLKMTTDFIITADNLTLCHLEI